MVYGLHERAKNPLNGWVTFRARDQEPNRGIVIQLDAVLSRLSIAHKQLSWVLADFDGIADEHFTHADLDLLKKNPLSWNELTDFSKKIHDSWWISLAAIHPGTETRQDDLENHPELIKLLVARIDSSFWQFTGDVDLVNLARPHFQDTTDEPLVFEKT